MEFSEVLTAVREWLGRVTVPAQINRDTDEGLWVFLESENALAELTVGVSDILRELDRVMEVFGAL